MLVYKKYSYPSPLMDRDQVTICTWKKVKQLKNTYIWASKSTDSPFAPLSNSAIRAQVNFNGFILSEDEVGTGTNIVQLISIDQKGLIPKSINNARLKNSLGIINSLMEFFNIRGDHGVPTLKKVFRSRFKKMDRPSFYIFALVAISGNTLSKPDFLKKILHRAKTFHEEFVPHFQGVSIDDVIKRLVKSEFLAYADNMFYTDLIFNKNHRKDLKERKTGFMLSKERTFSQSEKKTRDSRLTGETNLEGFTIDDIIDEERQVEKINNQALQHLGVIGGTKEMKAHRNAKLQSDLNLEVSQAAAAIQSEEVSFVFIYFASLRSTCLTNIIFINNKQSVRRQEKNLPRVVKQRSVPIHKLKSSIVLSPPSVTNNELRNLRINHKYMSEVISDMLTLDELKSFERAIALELIMMYNTTTSFVNDSSFSNIANHALQGGMYREARKYFIKAGMMATRSQAYKETEVSGAERSGGQHNTAHHSTAQHSTALHTTPHHTTPHHTTPYHN